MYICICLHIFYNKEVSDILSGGRHESKDEDCSSLAPIICEMVSEPIQGVSKSLRDHERVRNATTNPADPE